MTLTPERRILYEETLVLYQEWSEKDLTGEGREALGPAIRVLRAALAEDREIESPKEKAHFLAASEYAREAKARLGRIESGGGTRSRGVAPAPLPPTSPLAPAAGAETPEAVPKIPQTVADFRTYVAKPNPGVFLLKGIGNGIFLKSEADPQALFLILFKNQSLAGLPLRLTSDTVDISKPLMALMENIERAELRKGGNPKVVEGKWIPGEYLGRRSTLIEFDLLWPHRWPLIQFPCEDASVRRDGALVYENIAGQKHIFHLPDVPPLPIQPARNASVPPETVRDPKVEAHKALTQAQRELKKAIAAFNKITNTRQPLRPLRWAADPTATLDAPIQVATTPLPVTLDARLLPPSWKTYGELVTALLARDRTLKGETLCVRWGIKGAFFPYHIRFSHEGRAILELEPDPILNFPGNISLASTPQGEKGALTVTLDKESLLATSIHYGSEGPHIVIQAKKPGTWVMMARGDFLRRGTTNPIFLSEIKKIFGEQEEIPFGKTRIREMSNLASWEFEISFDPINLSLVKKITAMLENFASAYTQFIKNVRLSPISIMDSFNLTFSLVSRDLPEIEGESRRDVIVEIIRHISKEGTITHSLSGVVVRGMVLAPSDVLVNGRPLASAPAPLVLGDTIQISHHGTTSELDYEETGSITVTSENRLTVDTATWTVRPLRQRTLHTAITELDAVDETAHRNVTLEILEDRNYQTGVVRHFLRRAWVRGIEVTLANPGAEFTPGEFHIELRSDTTDYWQTATVRVTTADDIEVVDQEYYPTIGRTVTTEDNEFRLQGRVVYDPRTREYTLAAATLTPRLDLSFLGTGEHLFEGNATFQFPPLPIILNSPQPPLILRGGALTLHFTHASLGTVTVHISPDLVMTRDPIDPHFRGEALATANPVLESSPTQEALVTFPLTPHASRGYQRDGVRGRRYTLAPAEIQNFLTWRRLLGQPIEPAWSAEGRALEVRFGPGGAVTFHTTPLNSDSTLRVMGLDLSGDEYAITRLVLDSIARPAALPEGSAVSDEAINEAEVEIAWPTATASPDIDIVRGDIFVETEAAIRAKADAFADGKNPFAVGDSLPPGFLEFECPRSGLVLRFPGIFFGRVEQDGPGRARSPLKFLTRGQVQYYYVGHEAQIQNLPRNYVVRDMGGFPRLSVIQRTGSNEARWVDLASLRHPESDLFMVFGDVAGFLPADGDTVEVAEAKRRGLDAQRDLMRETMEERTATVLSGRSPPRPHVHMATRVFRRGEAVRFVFGRSDGEDELTGLRIDRTHRILHFENLQLNGIPVDPRYSETDPGIIILTGGGTTYEWHVEEGRLVRQASSTEEGAPTASSTSLIQARHISLDLIEGNGQASTGPPTVRSRPAVQVDVISAEGRMSPPTIAPERWGYPVGGGRRVISEAAEIREAVTASHVHGSPFKPVEGTLIEQLLVGQDEAWMTFVSNEGIILRVRTQVDRVHPRGRHIFSKVAHNPGTIEATLAFPDPKNRGNYLLIHPHQLTITSQRMSGEENNVLEISVTDDTEESQNLFSLELREVSTTQTLEGMEGSAGIAAFTFYGVDLAQEKPVEDAVFRARAASTLRSTLRFFGLDHGPDVQSVEGALLTSIEPPRYGIRLNNGWIVDASLAESNSNSFAFEGPTGNSRTARLRYESEESPDTVHFLSLAQDESGSSRLQWDDAERKTWNVIVTNNGELNLWRRRKMAEGFTAPRAFAEVGMLRIRGGAYGEGSEARTVSAPSLVERRIAVRSHGGNEIEGTEFISALGRSEGAGEEDLSGGRIPKVSYFIYEDSEGHLQALRGLLDEREIEKGDYHPFGYDALLVDAGAEEIVNNSCFVVRLVEDSWRDNSGVLRRGKVRIFFRNEKSVNLSGTAISPYGYEVFQNRTQAVGTREAFKQARVIAHYHEDPARFHGQKLMPGDPKSVYHRAGISPTTKIDWIELLRTRGEEAHPYIRALTNINGSFDQINAILTALQFLTDTATIPAERFITQAADGTYEYDDDVVASLARAAVESRAELAALLPKEASPAREGEISPLSSSPAPVASDTHLSGRQEIQEGPDQTPSRNDPQNSAFDSTGGLLSSLYTFGVIHETVGNLAIVREISPDNNVNNFKRELTGRRKHRHGLHTPTARQHHHLRELPRTYRRHNALSPVNLAAVSPALTMATAAKMVLVGI